MFAILVGTNTGSKQIDSVFKSLFDIAITSGFEPPETKLSIRGGQMPLDGWTLEQKGPADGKADFLLAVTAPKVPSISPIPVMQTVEGPLFAVVVMDSFFVVSREDRRDVSEFKDMVNVENSFKSFLRSLPRP